MEAFVISSIMYVIMSLQSSGMAFLTVWKRLSAIFCFFNQIGQFSVFYAVAAEGIFEWGDQFGRTPESAGPPLEAKGHQEANEGPWLTTVLECAAGPLEP